MFGTAGGHLPVPFEPVLGHAPERRDEQDLSMGMRIVTSPEDIPDGWYVIDDEVVRLEDAEFEKPKRGTPAPAASPTAIAASSHRFSIGDEIEMASGDDLDRAFILSVRGLWAFLLRTIAIVVGIGVLEASGLPWREDFAHQLLWGAAAALPLLLTFHLVWRRLTRSPDGRVTRAMAGRLRDDYDRQRGEASSPARVD
jgi:hypothetical protein